MTTNAQQTWVVLPKQYPEVEMASPMGQQVQAAFRLDGKIRELMNREGLSYVQAYEKLVAGKDSAFDVWRELRPGDMRPKGVTQ